MHGSIRDRLEDLLTADRSAVKRDMRRMRELLEHLSSCKECSTELQAMRAASRPAAELGAGGTGAGRQASMRACIAAYRGAGQRLHLGGIRLFALSANG